MTGRVTTNQPSRKSLTAKVSGHGFRMHAETSPTVLRTPGFPLLLAAIFAVAGHSLVAVQIVNLLFSLLTAPVTYAIARRIGASQAAAMLASVIFLPASSRVRGRDARWRRMHVNAVDVADPPSSSGERGTPVCCGRDRIRARDAGHELDRLRQSPSCCRRSGCTEYSVRVVRLREFASCWLVERQQSPQP